MLQAGYGPYGSLQSLAANLEQRCGENPAGLYGAVRYHAIAAPSADLDTAFLAHPDEARPGQAVSYTFVVTNHGPSPVAGAGVTTVLSPPLVGASWTCAAGLGATCGSGLGEVSDFAVLPAGGSLTYIVQGTVDTDARQELVARATAVAPDSVLEWNPANDSAAASTSLYRRTAFCDFDRDGKEDLVWQHARTGEVLIWSMNDTSRISEAPTDPDSSGALAWRVVGAADFNSDGKTDLLWHHRRTGALRLWFMDGVTKIGEAPTVPPRAGDPLVWSVAGTADFDGDGRPDILVQRGGGRSAIWFMDGAVRRIPPVDIPAHSKPSAKWKIVGIGDFDRDGLAHILWQQDKNVEKHLEIWNMIGANVVRKQQTTPTGFFEPRWDVAAVADLDGNGYSDPVWQHRATGELRVWHMNGWVLKNEAYTSPRTVNGADWRLVAPR